MIKTIYLAGAMTGLTYGKSEEWRTVAAKLFGTMPSIHLLNPSRDVPMSTNTVYQANGSELNPTGLSNPRALRARNLHDVKQSDLVLVNFLGAERVSLGSVYEVGYASALGIPVVCVMEKEGNFHDHLMLAPGLEYRFEFLVDAIAAVPSILGI